MDGRRTRRPATRYGGYGARLPACGRAACASVREPSWAMNHNMPKRLEQAGDSAVARPDLPARAAAQRTSRLRTSQPAPSAASISVEGSGSGTGDTVTCTPVPANFFSMKACFGPESCASV